MSLPNANVLAAESSPYLRQHAGNPVHWRPWSEAVLSEAVMLGKPILLSVGYAACHWCHVMAHQCFEDAEVAAVMNEHFVNIKVDREERPDIDQIYMAALTAMGEQGGWPLTMFLTPDARPFWGGTYFPKRQSQGRPGFIDVMLAVSKAWTTKRGQIEDGAAELTDFIGRRLDAATGTESATGERLLEFVTNVHGMIDQRRGGLRGAPKFPNAPFLLNLWLAWLEHGNRDCRDAVLLSLREMLKGGIYDHVGGGLARYSVDGDWMIPHFEKMLYDNAQLLQLLAFAHAETGEAAFAQSADEIVSWLEREMRVENGAYASSLDADSDGGEGRFYTWRRDEIARVLGSLDAGWFLEHHPLVTPSHWEGDPVLVSAGRALAPDERGRLSMLRGKLLEVRSLRPRPGRDDKVIAEWNGLAIAALATAARQFQRPEWHRAAHRAFNAVAASSNGDGRLVRCTLDGTGTIVALSSDYAAMITAAIALHGVDPDPSLLAQARQWREELDRDHADADGSGYYLTPADAKDVPLRIRGDVDEAIPSATAQVIEALGRLATATSDDDLLRHVERVIECAGARLAEQPYGRAGFINARTIAQAALKLVVAGPRSGSLAACADTHSDPRRVDILGIDSKLAGAYGLPLAPGGPAEDAAWLCTGQICLPPINSSARLDDELTRHRAI